MRMRELRRKEVINMTDGGRLGFVGDVDFHMPDGQAAALIIYGPARFSDCSAGERNTMSPGTVFSGSGTTSSSSTSLCSTATRRWSENGGKDSDRLS